MLDKVNRSDYVMLIGDVDVRVGNSDVTNVKGTEGEAALNNNNGK